MNIETANRLYEYRKKNNLSQEELAERIGVSRQAVSKWERAEASPDTDNLIMLAKIYGVTLDELLNGKDEEQEEEKKSAPCDDDDDDYDEDDDDYDNVSIGPLGINVESKDGDKVHIDLSGIHVESKDSKVHIGKGGTYIVNDGEVVIEKKKDRKNRFWASLPWPIICVIAYLIFGFYDIWGGWGLSWIIFITVPIYYSLVEAIYKRNPSEFAYPVLAAFAYLYLGMYHHFWHPSWIIFITIPVYYSIAGVFKPKKNK